MVTNRGTHSVRAEDGGGKPGVTGGQVFDAACEPHTCFLEVTRRHSDTDVKALNPLVQNWWDFCGACCVFEGVIQA